MNFKTIMRWYDALVANILQIMCLWALVFLAWASNFGVNDVVVAWFGPVLIALRLITFFMSEYNRSTIENMEAYMQANAAKTAKPRVKVRG